MWGVDEKKVTSIRLWRDSNPQPLNSSPEPRSPMRYPLRHRANRGSCLGCFISGCPRLMEGVELAWSSSWGRCFSVANNQIQLNANNYGRSWTHKLSTAWTECLDFTMEFATLSSPVWFGRLFISGCKKGRKGIALAPPGDCCTRHCSDYTVAWRPIHIHIRVSSR